MRHCSELRLPARSDAFPSVEAAPGAHSLGAKRGSHEETEPRAHSIHPAAGLVFLVRSPPLGALRHDGWPGRRDGESCPGEGRCHTGPEVGSPRGRETDPFRFCPNNRSPRRRPRGARAGRHLVLRDTRSGSPRRREGTVHRPRTRGNADRALNHPRRQGPRDGRLCGARPGDQRQHRRRHPRPIREGRSGEEACRGKRHQGSGIRRGLRRVHALRRAPRHRRDLGCFCPGPRRAPSITGTSTEPGSCSSRAARRRFSGGQDDPSIHDCQPFLVHDDRIQIHLVDRLVSRHEV